MRTEFIHDLFEDVIHIMGLCITQLVKPDSEACMFAISVPLVNLSHVKFSPGASAVETNSHLILTDLHYLRMLMSYPFVNPDI
jgi:hypothetical protein